MTNNAVTLVTRDATLDDLSASDYRDIYDELRQRDSESGTYVVSLDKFVTLVTSTYSKAQWSKYHNGEATLTRTMRNELRRCVGLKLLPPTVAEATAAASPDAAVWQVGGEGAAEHVIMVTTHAPITLHVNGAVTAVDDTAQRLASDDVTPVTRAVAPRRYYARPVATEAQQKRRESLGVKWADVLEAGLSALENGETH